MAQVHEKGVCRMNVTFSCLTHPCCSRTVTSRPLPTTTSLTIHSTRSCRTYLFLKAPDTRHSAREVRSWATWPNLVSTQVNEFDEITSVNSETMLIYDPDLNEISDFSKNTHENTGMFGVLTMFESTFLMMILLLKKKTRKACIGKPIARERERKEREGFVISVAESM